jgi:hypothetical protein
MAHMFLKASRAVQINSAFWLSIFLQLFLSSHLKGQDLQQSIKIDAEIWVLKDLLNYLTSSYQIDFAYSLDNIPIDEKIEISSTTNNLRELLKQISLQTEMEYDGIGGKIVWRRKNDFEKKPPAATGKLEGVVVDSTTNEALPFASVHINQSSIGAATNAEGKFILGNLPVGEFDFIFSYVGYQTLVTKLTIKPNSNPRLVVKMKPHINVLNDIVVSAKPDKAWMANYELFKQTFFGSTTNSRLCSILNPEVLSFIQTKSDLIVKASNLIKMENRALGYMVRLKIEEFRIGKNDYSLKYRSFFDSLNANGIQEKLRWEINRLNAYKGSEMHLFRSIINKRSWQEGFTVYKKSRYDSLKFREPSFSDQTNHANDEAVVFHQGQYLIRYEMKLVPQVNKMITGTSNPISIIEVVSPVLKSKSNGLAVLPANYFRLGYMDTQRLADKLPSDFDPNVSESNIQKFTKDNLGTIIGVLVDSTTRNPIANAEIFIDRSSLGTKTADNGAFIFTNVPFGGYDVVSAKAGYSVKHFFVRSIRQPSPTGDTLAISKRRFSPPQKINPVIRETLLAKFRNGFPSTQKIQNEDLISIYIGRANKVSFYSLLPIDIIDEQLGYKIKLYLEKSNQTSGMDDFFTQASCYFQEQDTLFEHQKIEVNRLDAYSGSFLNFSRAWYWGRIVEEGFGLVESNRSEHLKENSLLKNRFSSSPNSPLFTDKNMITQQIDVTYKSSKSWSQQISKINFMPSQIAIPSFGIVCPEFYGIYVEGKMKNKLWIPQLPLNYKTPKESPLNTF